MFPSLSATATAAAAAAAAASGEPQELGDGAGRAPPPFRLVAARQGFQGTLEKGCRPPRVLCDKGTGELPN